MTPLQFSKIHATPAISACVSFFKKSAKFITILAAESYAVFRYVIPFAMVWVWDKYVRDGIQTVEIPSSKTQKVAFLNIHGKLTNAGKMPVVLLCHGDYGHPYTLLHLAEIAKKEGMVVFSMYIPRVNDDQEFEIDNEYIKNALDVIENLIREKNGNFYGILGTGHSKGAILLAQQQFVNLDPRIKSTCSIAGGLNISKHKKYFHKHLVSVVKGVHRGIINNPKKSLVQIVPKEDWKIAHEAMAVRPYDHCYKVPGMHLSGLYKNETRKYFTQFLREFSLK
jgi:hypothetical protein